jgi:predicted nucleotidyltransferase
MDVEGLLKSLKEHKVRFVVIGATAFPVHGYSRATLDTDIFIDPTPKNAELAKKALEAFGYNMSDITIEDLLNNKILIRQYLVEADIHPFVKGMTFERVWKNKVKAKFGDIYVWFACLDDLITMKKSAGRHKDLDDLKVLRKLKKQQK